MYCNNIHTTCHCSAVLLAPFIPFNSTANSSHFFLVSSFPLITWNLPSARPFSAKKKSSIRLYCWFVARPVLVFFLQNKLFSNILHRTSVLYVCIYPILINEVYIEYSQNSAVRRRFHNHFEIWIETQNAICIYEIRPWCLQICTALNREKSSKKTKIPRFCTFKFAALPMLPYNLSIFIVTVLPRFASIKIVKAELQNHSVAWQSILQATIIDK